MKHFYAVLLTALFSSPLIVQAATKTWTGTTSTAWAVATNWSGSSLPATGDDVIIPTSPSGGRMPTINANYTVKSITIQTGATLTHTAGNLYVLTGAFSITGTYSMSGGSFLSDQNVTINNGGTISQTNGTIHLASTIGATPTDNLIISVGGNYSQSGSAILEIYDYTSNSGSPNGTFTQTNGTFRIYRDYKGAGTFTGTGSGTIEFAGTATSAAFPVTVTSTNTQFNNVLINSGVDPKFGATAAASFKVYGNWTNNSSTVSLSTQASTVIFNGTGTQTIAGSQSTTWRNLTINKTSGTATLSLDQSIANGNLSISAGTLDLNTFNLNRTAAGGTLTLSNSTSLKLADNTGGQTGSNFPLNFTTVSLGSTSTVEYDGLNSVTQTIYGAATYGNLSLTNGSGSGSAVKTTTANITVNGNLGVYSNAVLSPGAANTVGGSGTLSGSGTVRATRTAATADFLSQYTITNKTLTTLTVDYNSTGAQSINALNYYNLTISGARTTNVVTFPSGTVGVSGTISATATFTSGYYWGVGNTINFNAAGAQNIYPSFYYNLTVSGGPKTAIGDILVYGLFTLSGTTLTTSASNELIIADGASVTGAGLTAYVNGPVTKQGNEAFTFPVGKSGTGYMPISMSAPSQSSDAFTAEYMRSSASSIGSSITASGLFRVSNCDYWNLNRIAGSSAVNVTLSWNGYSNCNAASYVTDINTLTIAHFNGTSWDSHGKNSLTGNVSNGSITRNNVTSFSPFSIGSTVDFGNPLSVKFNSVKAEKELVGAKISWTNSSEINIDRYEIERETGSAHFSTAGQVTASGNTGDVANYEWVDITPLNGIVYYRIKAVAVDGSISYSSIVKVDGSIKASVLLYPNPVSGDQLQMDAASLAPGIYELKLYSMSGKEIDRKTLNHRGGAINEKIELPATMTPGIYSLHINGNSLNLRWTFIRK